MAFDCHLQNLSLAERENARDVGRADELSGRPLQPTALRPGIPGIRHASDCLHHSLTPPTGAVGNGKLWLGVRHGQLVERVECLIITDNGLRPKKNLLTGNKPLLDKQDAYSGGLSIGGILST
jgi:hypothetical protein